MSRKPPDIKAPELKERTDTELITQVRQYKVITPLFGGGVTPAEADPVTVVRGTEVRGHLRFWWRATRGGVTDGSLETLRESEGALWGSAAGVDKSGPSKVQIVVQVENPGRLVTPFRIDRGRPSENPEAGVPAYAAFPIQPTQEDIRARAPLKQVRSDVTFTLILHYPQAVAQDIEAALWAWETFGGIGARTRRGFGALHCLTVNRKMHEAPKRGEIRQAIQAGLERFVSGGKWPEDVPHLQQNLRFELLAEKNAGAAWRALIQRLRDFRQARTGKGYGQSLWPEPEEVYELFGRPAKRSRPPRVIHSFPRAQFGLPIQFEFPQHPTGPGKSILHGQDEDQDRLASPLILRPIACVDGAVGLAAILTAPRFLKSGLVLEETTTGKIELVTANVSAADARAIDPLDGETNVLHAFLDHFEWR